MNLPINLDEKFSRIDSYWKPRIVAELNGQCIKLAKVKGDFVWHTHSEEDEMFLVHRGELRIKLRDREVAIQQGEFFVVPRGVEHAPSASEEAEIILFEPLSTAHTGDIDSELTAHSQAWL